MRYLSADPAQRNQEKPALVGPSDREDEKNRTSYGRNTKDRDEVRMPTFPEWTGPCDNIDKGRVHASRCRATMIEQWLPHTTGPGVLEMGTDNPSLRHWCNVCGWDHLPEPRCPAYWSVEEPGHD